jgi:hypothetical protein
VLRRVEIKKFTDNIKEHWLIVYCFNSKWLKNSFFCYFYFFYFYLLTGFGCVKEGRNQKYLLLKISVGGENRSTQRKPPTCASHRTTLTHNVVLSTPRMSGIRTHNISIDCRDSCNPTTTNSTSICHYIWHFNIKFAKRYIKRSGKNNKTVI